MNASCVRSWASDALPTMRLDQQEHTAHVVRDEPFLPLQGVLGGWLSSVVHDNPRGFGKRDHGPIRNDAKSHKTWKRNRKRLWALGFIPCPGRLPRRQGGAIFLSI